MIDITDAYGKFKTSFTKAELAELKPEQVPLFEALRDANGESRAAEAALREATANKKELGAALSAAEAVLQKHRPKITEYDAIRAHLKSIGR